MQRILQTMFIIPVFMAPLTGCASYSETYIPNGMHGYSISCNGAMQSMSSCIEKAGEICGPKGYRVFNENGEATPIATLSASKNQMTGFAGSAIFRSLLISCGA